MDDIVRVEGLVFITPSESILEKNNLLVDVVVIQVQHEIESWVVGEVHCSKSLHVDFNAWSWVEHHGMYLELFPRMFEDTK